MNAAKTTANPIARSIARLAAIALAALGLATALASPAEAALELKLFDVSASGPQAAKAGGHADFTTDFEIDASKAHIKRFVADLPPGMLGNPNATLQCSQFDFFNLPAGDLFAAMDAGCRPATQVGIAEVTLAGKKPTNIPVFNMAPRNSSETARLAMLIPLIVLPVQISLNVRTEGDYGVEAVSDAIRHDVAIQRVKLTLWADPGHASHDNRRYSEALGDGAALCGFACVPGFFDLEENPGIPPRPFLSNPTRCGEELKVRATATGYGFPDEPFIAEDAFTGPGGLEDCDLVPFQPGFSVESSSSAPDSPTALDVETSFPRSDDLDVPQQSHLRNAVVTLPEGVSINPSAASGLQACTDEQLNMDSREAAECPNGSKLGQVTVTSQPLPGDGKLEGYLVQRPQTASETFRVAIVAEGHGVNAKIPGVVKADPQSGRLTTVFEETPQLPFTELEVRTDGGADAPLATPSACGTHTATATFTPWSGTPDAVRSDSFQTSGCATPRTLSPGFSAGTDNPLAGTHSPFRVRVTRADGEQELTSLQLSLPRGLAAKLAGVPYCPEATLASFPATPVAGTGQAELASPACPAASRIGSTTVGAGAGNPYYTSGSLYLAGPYKGAPLSVAAVVPAVAGPFDLGVVVVRTALHLDPRSAQVSAVSDPLPQIVGGIPLRVRDLRVELDRDGFALNPTDCSQMAVDGLVLGSEGARAVVSNRFQLADCAALGFKPRLKLRLFGKTHRGAYQGLRAVVRARPGDANIGRTVVRMPRSAFLAQEHIRTVCTRVQFAADACPPGSVYGKAVAYSPLLGYPLRGNVYLRSSDNTLPDLVADLRGPAHQPIRIELVGRTDSVKGALRNTFDVVPDAPVSYFRLNLAGGKKGLIRNSRNICAANYRAGVRLNAHNGATRTLRPVLRNTRCAKQRKAKRSSHNRHARVASASTVR